MEIVKNVYWVGVKDWNRRIFDSLIPLPQGTSYNSYLIVNKKTALIDTVNPGFEEKLRENIEKILDVSEIDYLVMNHAEPDHAGAIPYILELSDAVLLTTEKGAEVAKSYYGVPKDRTKVVGDGEVISLGSKTLKFIHAPWLHWPETMFTYLVEDRILFPCDFLGCHTAYGFYDDEVPEIIYYAQRYFGEIMMPFRNMGKKAMKKLKELEIDIIAPSHGPIYRNPERILSAYEKWTVGETRRKVIVVYASMWGATEKMVNLIADILLSEGVEVAVHNLAFADIGEIAKDLVDSRGIVLGTPTVLGGMHPIALFAVSLVKALRPPLRYGVAVSSFGWSGGAMKQISEMLSPMKIEILGAVEVKGYPSEEDLEKLRRIAKELAEKVKG
ncbi:MULTISPECIES: FprA family A-type flavoprotein [unclassified Archaeoglobus]|jgi:flavorubredoxin|uniref:FprA family A-type flavoprotein n=1 Tax=unclassified Archaeoglobus TaxID=2643606 RepID=UPI0025C6EE5F|nr:MULTISPECIES: FprA family A-type flavoprotein [unclassified Archaeoglobus]